MEKIISFLFFAYLVFFPFGQLTRLPLVILNSSEVHLYFNDILIFLLIISWGVWKFLIIRKKYHPPSLTKPIIFFSLVALISLLVNIPLLAGREVIIAALYLLRWVIYISLYFVISDLKNRFNSLKWPKMAHYLIAIGTVTAIFGLIQYIFWPNLSALEALEWDPHYYRLIGTFLDPGFSGIIYVLTLIILMVLNWNKIIRPKRGSLWIYCLLGLNFLALILTYSRSSYLAFLVAACLIALKERFPRIILIIFLLSSISFLCLPRTGGEGVKLERITSVKARIGNWQQAWQIAKDHLLLGVGFDTYRYRQRDYGFLGEKWQVTHAGAGADSSLLFILATTGIIGLASYGWFLWSSVRYSLKATHLEARIIIFASLAALIPHSLFLNSLFYPWVIGWLGVILAIG